MTRHSVEMINTTIAMTLNTSIRFLARNAQIFCQIAEHDIEVETKEDVMDDIALECDVVDQYLRWEVVADQYLRMR